MAYNVFVSYSTKNLPIAGWTGKSTLHQPGHVEIFVRRVLGRSQASRLKTK